MSNESADEKVTNVKEEEGEEKHEEIVTESSSIIGTSMDIEETTEQTEQTVAGEAVNKSTGSVLTPFVEFAEDVDLRLGRANGNVFHRKQGVEGGHDGQIMVRLKKKRFIVIDYGIVPTISDMATAAMNPHITCPPGAGKQVCATPGCSKIGVPVLLHDSDPEQPHSLYMRSGLCFTCQRLLNEKRRTQRKRKSDTVSDTSRPSPSASSTMPEDAANLRNGLGPSDIHAFSMDSSVKRFRLNGEILDLAPDAIIINGPLEGTKHQGPSYDFHDIGNDLTKIVHDSYQETEKLVAAVAACTGNTKNAETTEVYPDSQSPKTSNSEQSNAEPTASAVNDTNDSSTGGEIKKSTQVQILSLYEKAFLSMSKGIFLLSQWKASWDIGIASQVKPKAPPISDNIQSATVGEPSNVPPIASLPDSAILASAAAVAAAQSVAVSSEQSSPNMIPLLLAAQAKDSKKEGEETSEGKTNQSSENGGSKVEVFGV